MPANQARAQMEMLGWKMMDIGFQALTPPPKAAAKSAVQPAVQPPPAPSDQPPQRSEPHRRYRRHSRRGRYGHSRVRSRSRGRTRGRERYDRHSRRRPSSSRSSSYSSYYSPSRSPAPAAKPTPPTPAGQSARYDGKFWSGSEFRTHDTSFAKLQAQIVMEALHILDPWWNHATLNNHPRCGTLAHRGWLVGKLCEALGIQEDRPIPVIWRRNPNDFSR